MRLAAEDAQLFYKLMYPLQFYVKQKRRLLPEVKSQDEYVALNAETKLAVRDALYEHPAYIDEFIAENPARLSLEELAIVRSWKQFVKGDFFIERYLKKYSIWIGGKPSHIYGVLGIMDSLDEIVHPSYLPMRIHGVLLPWQGQIIYDGVFQSYNVMFGSGIKGSLREEYMTAKQNGRIIETLEKAQSQQEITETPGKDWSEEAGSLVRLANQFKGPNEPLQGEAFVLLKAVAALTQIVVDPKSDLNGIWSQFKKVQRALNKLETALNRAD